MAAWKRVPAGEWRIACRWCAWLCLWCLLTAIWWPTSSLLAQPVEEHPDVRVIIDVSGSMKANDPDQLAASALEMLVSLLPGGVTAGVWTFGERVDNALPLGEVDTAWRERALALSPVLVEYQQFTDIEAVVREAAIAPANGWRHLVLLTDGMIDLPPGRGSKPAIDVASRRTLLEALAPALAEQGVAVHGIAFSDEADLSLVERLSQLTGGLSARVENPDSLLVAFLDIVERIFPSDRVPLMAGRFIIDPGVESFSVLAFHEPGVEPLRLIAPDGSVHLAADPPQGMRWQVQPRFDLVRMVEPRPGEWRLEGDIGDDSRVSVVSPLTLHTTGLPSTLYLGFPLRVEAWVEEEGEPLTAGLDDIAMRVELRDLQDSLQAAVALEAGNGRYRGELPAPALTGNARLVIDARGKSFNRQRVQAMNVLPAVGAAHDPRSGRVELVAEHPRLDHHNTHLTGELAGETLVAETAGPRRWQIALPDLDEALGQPLLLSARVTLDGETRHIRLPRLLLNPEARTILDRADLAGPTLSAERFHEDLDPDHGAEEDAADRFVAMVNALPGKAMKLWQEGAPGLQRLAATLARDPRFWAGAAFGLVLLLAVLFARSLRRSRGSPQREEPHV